MDIATIKITKIIGGNTDRNVREETMIADMRFM